MTRGLGDALRWVEAGTELCAEVIDGLADGQFEERSGLPGWDRAHVVAHLAANAAALRNLARWASSGEETPMYSSPNQRTADIATGATRPPWELRSWLHREATALADDLAALTREQWRHPVRTAQGREVPASEIPWLRAREVMVHAVDVGPGLTFADLPQDFLAALSDDITAKRGAATVPPIVGTLADRTAYLAGRGSAGVTSTSGGPAPDLPPWL